MARRLLYTAEMRDGQIHKLLGYAGICLCLAMCAAVSSGRRSMRTAQVRQLRAEPQQCLPRWIFIPDVPNMRDMGGWPVAGGRRVRMGMIYRSSAFDRKLKWYDFGFRPHASAASVDFITKNLGVRTDLDLRSAKETEGMSQSPLGPSVQWINIPAAAYGAIDSPEGRSAFASVFRVLLNVDNYPVVLHCQFGRDRAGTVAFLLNGLLGVPTEKLADDWELSTVWFETGRYTRERCAGAIVAAMNHYAGGTFAEKVVSYVESLGFTRAEIDRFVELMTEKVDGIIAGKKGAPL